MESILRRTVKNQSSKDVKKVLRSLQHISAQNSILHAENRGLRESLAVKKRQHKKSYTLQLNNSEEYHGGAVFWSPKKVRQARDDEIVRQQQAQQLQLQKAQRTQQKEQARLYKLQEAENRRVERERLKEVREKERAAKAAQKEAQKVANDAEKAIKLSQNGKRKASQSFTHEKKRQKRVINVPSRLQVEVAAQQVPPKRTKTYNNCSKTTFWK